MNISVNKQFQKFYLAFDEWVESAGHEIRVGEYRFCATRMETEINVSEVTSGCKVFNIPLNEEILAKLKNKEDTLNYYLRIGAILKASIRNTPNFDEELERKKSIAISNLGEIPDAKDINTEEEWMYESISDLLH